MLQLKAKIIALFDGVFNAYRCYTQDHYNIKEGSPTPGLQTSTGPWPASNGAAQQEVSSG